VREIVVVAYHIINIILSSPHFFSHFLLTLVSAYIQSLTDLGQTKLGPELKDFVYILEVVVPLIRYKTILPQRIIIIVDENKKGVTCQMHDQVVGITGQKCQLTQNIPWIPPEMAAACVERYSEPSET